MERGITNKREALLSDDETEEAFNIPTYDQNKIGSNKSITSVDDLENSFDNLGITPARRQLVFFILYFVIFVDTLGFGLVMPALPTELEDRWHADENGMIFGIITATFSIMQMFGSAIAGALSDWPSIGRTSVITFCLLGSSITLTGMGFVQNVPQLLVVRGIDGFMSATVGVAQACIADLTLPEERAKYMGFVGAASGFGLIAGPSIGGFVYEYYGFGVTCFVGAGVSFINFFLAIFFLRMPKKNVENEDDVAEKMPWKENLKSKWRLVCGSRPLACVFFGFFLAQTGFITFQSYFSPYGINKWWDWGEKNVIYNATADLMYLRDSPNNNVTSSIEFKSDVLLEACSSLDCIDGCFAPGDSPYLFPNPICDMSLTTFTDSKKEKFESADNSACKSKGLVRCPYSLPIRKKFVLSPEELGAILAGFGAVMIVSQIIFTGPCSKRFGEKKTAIGGSILRVFTLLWLANSVTQTSCIMASMVFAVTGSLVSPPICAMASNLSDEKNQGLILGTNQLFGAFSRGISPIIAAVIYVGNEPKSHTWPFTWLSCTAMVLCALVLIPVPREATGLPSALQNLIRINGEGEVSSPKSVYDATAVGDVPETGGYSGEFSTERVRISSMSSRLSQERERTSNEFNVYDNGDEM